PIKELLKIKGFNETTIEVLREKAKAVLTTLELARKESIEDSQSIKDFLNLSGMNYTLATNLISHGISTLEILAEQGIEDLKDIERGLNNEQAGKIIMAARNICWFSNAQK
ncbi:MAG: helix-hairpin-helix domain-containing protein, partial [Arsenophonus sp. ET-DL12-MAG3]